MEDKTTELMKNENVPEVKKKKNILLPIIVGSIIILAVMIGILMPVIAKSNTEKKYHEQLNLGNKYLSELNYEQAIASYEAAILINPKGTDAYLGLASVYEGLEDYETALDVLHEGLEITGAEIFTQEIARVEELLELQRQAREEVIEENEVVELVPVVPSCVIDNVYHPAYYEFEFSDEQKEYLDHIIGCLMTEGYVEAVQLLNSEQIESICAVKGNPLYFVEAEQKSINFIYNNMKVCMRTAPHGNMMLVMPLSDGVGYGVQRGDYIGTSYMYGSCTNGLFNGEFTCVADINRGEYYETCEIKGTLVNGLLDGELSRKFSNYTELTTFSTGHVIYWNLKETENGEPSYSDTNIVYDNGYVSEVTCVSHHETIEETAKWLEESLHTFEHELSRNIYALSYDGQYHISW